MYPIPGHLALSLAGTTLARKPHIPAIAATFLADIVDKCMSDVFYLAPYGRCWMHTLLLVGICTMGIYCWKGKDWALSWFIGHVLHLVGDIGFIPWFYPFLSYDWPDAPNMVATTAQGIQQTIEGISPVQDATGTIHIKGFQYSAIVKQVFQLKLILLESVMCLCSFGLMYLQAKEWYRWMIPVGVTFVIAMIWRLLFQFPETLFWIGNSVESWIS